MIDNHFNGSGVKSFFADFFFLSSFSLSFGLGSFLGAGFSGNGLFSVELAGFLLSKTRGEVLDLGLTEDDEGVIGTRALQDFWVINV